MARILVVVAHRDDETIGAGGLIAMHADAGDEVLALSMTDGTTARVSSPDPIQIQSRLQASAEAASILGFTWLPEGIFPDNQMDVVPLLDVVRFIESAKSDFQPEKVITHFPFDLNIDHAVTARAVFTAFRSEPLEQCREVLSMEVASSTDFGAALGGATFVPDTYVDVLDVYPRKRDALGAYKEEIRPYPHTRSARGIELQAQRRGAEVGLEFAEAFRTHRRILGRQ